MIEIITGVFSLVIIFILPGLGLSFIFFTWNEISYLERCVLSIGLSVAVVPLLVFYCNLVGIKITRISVIMEILALLSIIGGILVVKDYRNQKN